MKKINDSNARTYTLLLIAVTFVLRLLVAAYTGLGIGESYYFRGALKLDLSYFDQPPLFFWLGGISIKLLGLTTLGLRFPSVLLFAGTSWLLFLVTRLMFNSRAGFWAVLIMNLSAVFTIPIACWFQPDAPLMFFWLLSTYFIVQLLFNKKADGSIANRSSSQVYLMWLLIGVSMGLDILSKYHVLFLFVGVFLFIITNKDQRHWLTHPGPYIAVVISLAMSFPVLWWNYNNHWVSFVFQGSRAGNKGHFSLHPEWFLRSILGQAIWLLPWIWVPVMGQLIKSIKLRNQSKEFSFLMWTSVLTIIFFTTVTLWSDLQYHFHWQAPGYMMLFMPLGFAIDTALSNHANSAYNRTRRWVSFTTWFTVIIVFAVNLHQITGFWQAYGPKWIVQQFGGKSDPTMQGQDYNDIETLFEQKGWMNNPKVFTGSTRWWLTGKVDWALKGKKPIIVFDEDPRNLAFLVDPRMLTGSDAVIFGQEHQASIPVNVAPFFDNVQQLPDVIIHRNGRDELHLQVYYCKNFHISKQPHPEFPVYRQLEGKPPFGK
ncbi:glycosyltransferase family 39 protein [Mucilaginibacter sp. RS28]|uniref:Glycosyltransferase family 39 protein n=1 Tax=Mucilaginibacter straminoryzae TaxID=2932774 RepID=A0A9X1X5X2_9SPHI|nr:glycosyltransferase family 39 protein [Mucilaginibacter straminoryzae]MCJ8210208.1 glycosyltransferase family 39 protein [Mucilaginibacter straminoryzae]